MIRNRLLIRCPILSIFIIPSCGLPCERVKESPKRHSSDNLSYLVVTTCALMKTLEDETPPEIPSLEGGGVQGEDP